MFFSLSSWYLSTTEKRSVWEKKSGKTDDMENLPFNFSIVYGVYTWRGKKNGHHSLPTNVAMYGSFSQMSYFVFLLLMSYYSSQLFCWISETINMNPGTNCNYNSKKTWFFRAILVGIGSPDPFDHLLEWPTGNLVARICPDVLHGNLRVPPLCHPPQEIRAY